MPSRNNPLLSRPFCLSVIVAVSLLMHVKGLSSPLTDYHYHRQCNTAAIARNFHENGLNILKPQIDWEGPYRGKAATEFPLYMWLMGLLWPVAGLGELWGRVLAAAFSALTAAYLFRLMEDDLGREASFYAGVLFSLVPLEVYFGRTVQPEALALLATVAAFHHWRLALGPGRPWAHWAAAVSAAFLAVSHKLPYAYLLLPMAWLAWERLGRRMLRDASLWGAFLLIVAGVFSWYRYASSGAYVVPTNMGAFLSLLNYERLPYYIQFQFLARFPELVCTYVGLFFAAVGAHALLRRAWKPFYGVWFAAVVLTIIACGGYSFHHEYTSLPLAAACAAFMGAGLHRLREGAAGLALRRRPWARAGLVLLVFSMPVYSALRIKHWYKDSFPFLSHAARIADRVSAPEDLFICNERAASVFLFYLHRRGWAVPFSDLGPNAEAETEKRIREGARFFATGKAGPFADRGGETARRFHARFPVVHDQDGLLIFRVAP